MVRTQSPFGGITATRCHLCITVMDTLSRFLASLLRMMIAAACCFGIWCSWELMRADLLFRSGSEAGVREAIRVAPEAWPYYVRLAELNPSDAGELLKTALRLNPYDAPADMELGMHYEAEGDSAQAEKLLLAASEVDRSYRPRWALAYYYLRHGNMPGFWMWARRASDVPADDLGPIFELCWRVDPDPEKIAVAALKEKPELLRQYLVFLLAKNQLDAADDVAPHLLKSGDPATDTPLLLSMVTRLMSVGEASSANALWQLLVKGGWVVADVTVPNNSHFEREPLPVSFDWSLSENPGFHSWTSASGLRTEFTGAEPGDCTVAEQVAPLAPGDYSMSIEYHTSQIAKNSGLHWRIIDMASNAVLATSSDLSGETLQRTIFDFSVPPNASFVRIRLAYRQVPGTPKISGDLMVLSTAIQPESEVQADSGIDVLTE